MPPELQKQLKEQMFERELDRLVDNELEYAHEINDRENKEEIIIEDQKDE